MAESVYVNPGKLVLSVSMAALINKEKLTYNRGLTAFIKAMTTLDKGDFKSDGGAALLKDWLAGGQLRAAEISTKTVVTLK
jgi:hypothetical protein